jgi:hypothetical protein
MRISPLVNPALPYVMRLAIFNRLKWPSVGPRESLASRITTDRTDLHDWRYELSGFSGICAPCQTATTHTAPSRTR